MTKNTVPPTGQFLDPTGSHIPIPAEFECVLRVETEKLLQGCPLTNPICDRCCTCREMMILLVDCHPEREAIRTLVVGMEMVDLEHGSFGIGIGICGSPWGTDWSGGSVGVVYPVVCCVRLSLGGIRTHRATMRPHASCDTLHAACHSTLLNTRSVLYAVCHSGLLGSPAILPSRAKIAQRSL